MHKTFIITTTSKNSVGDYISVKVSAERYEIDEGFLEFMDDDDSPCATFCPGEWKWVV